MITSLNRWTGQPLGTVTPTALDQIQALKERATLAQKLWSAQTPAARAKIILNLREIILDRVDELALLISNETGKPLTEALAADLFPAVEILTYFSKKSPRLLRDKSIFLHNPLIWNRKSKIAYSPLGVVAVISPWNFPFFLPMAEIALALLAGNAVLFKPSEVTPLVGAKIQELCDQAGLPPDLLQTLQGDGSVGQGIIQSGIHKIFFTGSVATGKKIAALAAQNLTPVNLELGGKDAMIVLADADLDFATSAALWGANANSGQMCASTERLILHERIAEPFLNLYRQKLKTLRPDIDLGRITSPAQKQIYNAHLKNAQDLGAQILEGGEYTQSGDALLPTLLAGAKIESTLAYREESFGPLVAATTFKTIEEAIQKTNDSPYGLLASIITRNLPMGEQIARQLQVGTVTINEVAFTAALPETPWGGIKNSGGGRKHSDLGFYEFLNARHINQPRLFIFRHIKSIWWYPYGPAQETLFKAVLELRRLAWVDRLRAIPALLVSFVRFVKSGKRT